jgi:hypothetical protein
MKTLLCIAACAIASIAWAGDEDPLVKTYSLQVKERVQKLELINVTARQAVSTKADQPDAELQAILDDIEALEAGKTE